MISPSALTGRGRLVRISNSVPRSVRTSDQAPCSPGAEALQHQRELPDRPHLEAVEVEVAIVDRRVGRDDRAAAVEPAVADRDLHRPGPHRRAVLADPGGEAAGLGERPERRHRVAEPAPAPLQVARELAGEIGREPDSGDVEEQLAVDAAEVDPPPVPGEDDVGRLVEVGRDAERAGEVVRGAGRQDAERQAGLDEARRRQAEAAVAARDDRDLRRAGGSDAARWRSPRDRRTALPRSSCRRPAAARARRPAPRRPGARRGWRAAPPGAAAPPHPPARLRSSPMAPPAPRSGRSAARVRRLSRGAPVRRGAGRSPAGSAGAGCG